MNSWIALLLAAIVLAAPGGAEPRSSERSAIQAGVARKVLDAAVAEGFEKGEWVRIVAVFAHEPGASPSVHADAARARIAPTGFAAARRYSRIPAIAGYINATALALLLEDPHVVRISLERPVQSQLAQAVPLVNLDDLHALGLEGAGAQVAVIDTGVDLDHPDLAGAVVAERCFCDDGVMGPAGCCPNGQDDQSGAGAGQDDHGHGTRVAGVLTSGGVHAPLGGAPDAQLVAIKALNASGGGFGSDLLAALDWILQFQPNVSVVNMSLGGGLYAGHCDSADAVTIAFASTIDQLYAAGVLTVAGAGNNQSGTAMILPACLEKAVSVGAVWDANLGSQSFFGCTDATTFADKVACWSNSNATTDVFAPGALITSSLLNGTSVALAGTSYATPVVSACAAVLVAAHPGATPSQISEALAHSNTSVVDAKNGLSFPRLDCLAAHQFLTASVPSLSQSAWLHLAILLAVGGVAVQWAVRRRARVR